MNRCAWLIGAVLVGSTVLSAAAQTATPPIASSAPAASTPEAARTECTPADDLPFLEAEEFVRLNGVVFFPWDELAADALGPQVGEVTTVYCDDAALSEPCLGTDPDGAATYLPRGTTLYAVRGYATTFRLAVRRGEEIVLYEAWCSDWAKVGADLFDIYGRVERVTTHSTEVVFAPEVVINDRATVEALVGMLLAGRIVDGRPGGIPAGTLPVTLHLDDGTTTGLGVAPDGRALVPWGWIEMSPAFRQTLERAVAEQGPAAATSGASASACFHLR